MAVPVPEGARPVFAEGKDRQRLAFLWVFPFIFKRDNARMLGESFKLGFIGEEVTETLVTGAVRTFLKEGSDTSKNF